MEIVFTPEEMQKRKLMIMTPMYGGLCYSEFALSFSALQLRLATLGIQVVPYFLTNESLVQRARNYCADVFLRSDCSHAMFIDADIGFNPEWVVFMLAMMTDESPYDVVTAPYPKKNISWEKIKLAVDKGRADKNPDDLANYVGDFVLTPKHTGEFNLNEPFEIAEAGTGFMMIRRKTFEVVREHTPHQSYIPDHARSEDFDGSREIHAFFDCPIDSVSRRYLSEDYYFCKVVQEAGMQVWSCPWMNLTHTGTYTFGGSMAHLASIGADATAVAVTEAKAKKKGKAKK